MRFALGELGAATVVKGDFAAGEVDAAGGYRERVDVGRAGRRAAEHGVDPGQELVDAERLHDVVVGAEAETADAVGLFAAGGQDDDGERGADVADFAEDFQTGLAGKDHVEEHQVELAAEGHLAAFVAAARLQHRVAGVGERIDDATANGGVVFDGEDGLRGHGVTKKIARERARKDANGGMGWGLEAGGWR